MCILCSHQCAFTPGASTEEVELPPFLQTATVSLSKSVAQALTDEERAIESWISGGKKAGKGDAGGAEGAGKMLAQAFGDKLANVGSLGSLSSEMSSVDGFVDVVRRVTGARLSLCHPLPVSPGAAGCFSRAGRQGAKNKRNRPCVGAVCCAGRSDYQFGDLTKEVVAELTGKPTYEFGDLTRTALRAANDAASNYKFGDITKGFVSLFSDSFPAGEDRSAALPEQQGQGGGGGAGGAEEGGEMAAGAAEEESAAVHVGFLRGYLSVRERLIQMLTQLRKDGGGKSDGPWTIYVTGHSLGGALATLCAADIGRVFDEDSIIMYNFGSPRVGNLAFVKEFNEVVPEAFRVVNDADVVARVPRSRLQNYFHVGRTVLVTNKPGRAVWVEGESDGTDPLKERWGELSELIDAEVSLMQGLVAGNSLGDHMEDAYFVALRNALSDGPPANVG
jgi:hypothetical protein